MLNCIPGGVIAPFGLQMSLVGSGGRGACNTATHVKEICLSQEEEERESVQWERLQQGCHGFSTELIVPLTELTSVNIPSNLQNIYGYKGRVQNLN